MRIDIIKGLRGRHIKIDGKWLCEDNGHHVWIPAFEFEDFASPTEAIEFDTINNALKYLSDNHNINLDADPEPLFLDGDRE
jgi:hypothetical protein